MEPFLRNTTNASKFDNRVHETGTDSSVGETVTRDGFHLARLSDGHRLVEGSVPTHAHGRCGGRDLLGFTHYWARSRNGYWVVKLKTAKDRFTRAVRSIDHWCRDNRHLPIREQHKKLNEKLRGHYAYYGVTGNSAALTRFFYEVGLRWRRWLNRRNNLRSMTWEKFLVILRRYPLAPVRTVRSTLRHAANP